MSINRPAWPHSAIQILESINAELVDRLNADPSPQALWVAESGQLNLSKPGGLRVVWSLGGGQIHRGWQVQGPDLPAKCCAIRVLRLTAEIRQPGDVGISADTIQQAEEVLRALILTWDHQRPGDFDEPEQEEDWAAFTSEPEQREVVVRYSVSILLPVLDDPYLFKHIDEVDGTGVLVLP